AARRACDENRDGRARRQRPGIRRRDHDAQSARRPPGSIVSPLIPQPYQLPAIALLLIGGVIAWSAGYRLFRVVLSLYGFILGALVGTSIFGASDTTLLIFGALGGGIVGAVIMFFGYFVGVARVGAAIGALGVHMLWSRFGGDPHPFAVIFAAVAGAAAAMALQQCGL